jgi:serine/threonine protein phosphatase 1
LKVKSLKRLFRRQQEVRRKPRVPDGLRVYAIGDIHGRADLLGRLITQIADDIERSPIPTSLCVLLGDYVDRGSQSRFVLDMLSADLFPTEMVPLRGNHEMMFLEFLSDAGAGASWRGNGGVETVHSYGIDVSGFRKGRDLEQVAHQFRSEVPAAHIEFLRKTQLSITVGDYFFCHAGIRPGVPLDLQQEEDLLWIREEFLFSEVDHGKVIVHGHTPVLEPDVRPNRINVDTGAYITGRLSALVLEEERQRFLST